MVETARRSRFLVSLFAVTALAAPSMPVASRMPPRPQVADTDGPVRCKLGQGDYDAAYRGNLKRQRTGGLRSGPVSPPPPAPPVMVSPHVMQSAPVASEAARIAPPYPLPYPVIRDENRERYDGKEVASIHAVANEPVSTFSVDVDTGSYANVRRFLTQGQMPPVSAVRTEEMLNYFRYDYPVPADRSKPFSVTTDMAVSPWNADTRVLRVGIKGFDLPKAERPPANLVFLVDVSGSMFAQDKLPLVKTSLAMLADRLSPKDKVSIVVYAGAAGIVLEPTSKAHHVKAALECLQAGGSTAGGQGMELAYATAKANYIKGGVNRVIMATDGDFNVGISSNEGIEAIVKKHREAGITLTTLGFGQGNYNEAMMERVADVGNGNYAYIDSPIEAQKVLSDEMASTVFTIAKDVKIQIEFNPAAVKEYRLIGYENRLLAEEDFDNDKVDAGDIGSGHQVTALYEIVPAHAKGWLPDRRYESNRTAPIEAQPAELAWLKLRYKLPDGSSSMLIERPVPVGLMYAARAPRGDMAFVCAVAAFGQKLRGDKYLGSFDFADIGRLAGDQNGYLRAEFLKLNDLAGARSGSREQASLR
jgi:Ca-activated chloride channel homolog